MTQLNQSQSNSTQRTPHLTHEQICDLLLSQPDSNAGTAVTRPGVRSVIQSAAQRQYRDHLDACLICASELDLLRRSTTAFRSSAVAVAGRELPRHSMPSHFASLYTPRYQRFATPTLFWAATALLFAAILPLGVISARHNPVLNQPVITASTSTPESGSAQADRDAALLNSIDQDLSAAVPSSLSPLTPPTETTQPEN